MIGEGEYIGEEVMSPVTVSEFVVIGELEVLVLTLGKCGDTEGDSDTDNETTELIDTMTEALVQSEITALSVTGTEAERPIDGDEVRVVAVLELGESL